MARRNSNRAMNWRRAIKTASTIVIAGFATGCEDEVDRSAVFVAGQAQHKPVSTPASAAAPAPASQGAEVVAQNVPTAAPPVMIANASVGTPALAPVADLPQVAGASADLEHELAEIELLESELSKQELASTDEGVLLPVVGSFAEVDAPTLERAEAAYVPQISDSVRAAYIAQIDATQPGNRMAVRSGDQLLGNVQFQVADGVVSVHIGEVLDLFEAQIDSVRFAELRGSRSAAEFVSLHRLQAEGIPLDYSAAYDELTLDSLGG